MSKKRKIIDEKQIPLDFDRQIETYIKLRDDLVNDNPTIDRSDASYEDWCIEIAVAIKKAIRQSGLSREAMVCAINEYFKNKNLSIHMFNHYLSKPAEYPIPAVYLPAIIHICNSVEPANVLVEADGARVITRDELQALAIGELDNALQEIQRLRKELRGRK